MPDDIYLDDDGIRKGELGFSITSMPNDLLSLGTILDVWRNFHKLLIAIGKDIGTSKIDWKIARIVVDEEDGQQRIRLVVRAHNQVGAQAEQLFVDLINLLKERRSQEMKHGD